MADIYTLSDLNDVSNNLSGSYRLMADINIGSFTPIGFVVGSSHDAFEVFTGTFDGNGFKLKDGSISFSGDSYVGLFSYNAGTIRRLGIENVNVNGGDFAGAIAGWNTGTIEDTYIIGDMTVPGGAWSTGGMVGRNIGMIRRCWKIGDVTKGGGSASGTGGISGTNGSNMEGPSTPGRGTIMETCFIGTVTSGHSGLGTGGIVGPNAGNILNCFVRGTISDNGSNNGGISGTNGYWGQEGNVINCYSTALITAADGDGLIGTGGASHRGYYDMETSGKSGTERAQPRSTEDMTFTYHNPENFNTTYLDWDFQNVWIRDVWGANDGYPLLRGPIGKVAFAIMEPSVIRSARPFIPCRVVFMNLLNASDNLHYKLSSPIETIDSQENPELFGFSMDGGAKFANFPPNGLPAVDALGTVVVGQIRVPPRTRVGITPYVRVIEGDGDAWWNLTFVRGEAWWETGGEQRRADWWNIGFPDGTKNDTWEPYIEHEVTGLPEE